MDNTTHDCAYRSAALKDSENGVKEANKNFLAGEGTWFENINEWSNLPEEEFVKQHCGMKQTPGTLFRTLILLLYLPTLKDQKFGVASIWPSVFYSVLLMILKLNLLLFFYFI